MMPMALALVAEVCDGALGVDARSCGAEVVLGVSVDSRSIEPGQMFVALRGERVDGHDFAAAALAHGALAVLAERDIPGVPCVVVSDSVEALGRLAHWYRRHKLTATVVGITGSSGKTTTKDLVADTLDGNVVAAQGSFNTEIGVPLTILRADSTTEYLVLEMGMRGLGHIRYLADVAEPDIGVVLNVGTAHLGMMSDPGDIARAKGELVEALTKEGYAVINDDDPQVRSMVDRTQARVVRFGTTSTADIRASAVCVDDEGRPSFDLHVGDADPVHVDLHFHGEHFVDAALASAAVGHVCGMAAERIARKLSAARPRSRWRMEVQRTSGGVTVISDVYNANPESVRAALKALRSMSHHGRSWAVLGEMRELGEASTREHDAIGRLAVRLDVSRLVCVGAGTKVMHLAASNEGSWGDESTWVEDADAAIALLDAELRPGDVVLVKASRAVGLEAITEHLLSDAVGAP